MRGSRRRTASRGGGRLGPHEFGTRQYYAATVEGGSSVVDRKDSGEVYEVHRVTSEAVALEYLRRRDVRRECYQRGCRCRSCGSAACAACYRVTGEQAERDHEAVPWRRCWVCDGPVTCFVERE